jgi:hypothetical protein
MGGRLADDSILEYVAGHLVILELHVYGGRHFDSVLEDQIGGGDSRVVGILPSIGWMWMPRFFCLRNRCPDSGKSFQEDQCIHWRLLHGAEGWTPISTSSVDMKRGFG